MKTTIEQIEHAAELIAEEIDRAAAEEGSEPAAVLAETDIRAELQRCGLNRVDAAAIAPQVRAMLAERY